VKGKRRSRRIRRTRRCEVKDLQLRITAGSYADAASITSTPVRATRSR
jgi:hypothetical protein